MNAKSRTAVKAPAAPALPARRSPKAPSTVRVAALPPGIPPADMNAPTVVCTTSRGYVQCTDEKGTQLDGEKLERLQQLLKSITEAPALTTPVSRQISGNDSSGNEGGPTRVTQASLPRGGGGGGSGNVAPDAPEAAPAPRPVAAQGGNVSPDAPAPRAAPAPAKPQQVNAGNVPPGAPLPAQAPPPQSAPSRSPGNVPQGSTAAASTSSAAATPVRNAGNVPPGDAQPRPAAAASVAAGRSSGGRFPGNVDPSQYLAAPEFDKVLMEFTQRNAGGPPPPGASQPKVIQVLNEKGLVPGNMPPEMGDILKAIEAANSQQVRQLKVALIPGNIPPDSAGGPRALGVEFSPAGVQDKQSVAALTMQLTPGNVPPEIDNVLAFLSSAKPQQVSATPAQRAGPAGGVADAS